jgi:hypothetical protein
MRLRSLGSPWWWPVLLAALCCLSCSRGAKLNEVRGKVLYKDQPLAGALVTFHPKEGNEVTAVRPTGFTAEDGTFTLTSGQKSGAAAGEYVVTIICSELPKDAKKGMSTIGIDSQDRLQGAYANRAASKITVEIKEGPNELAPFDLK